MRFRVQLFTNLFVYFRVFVSVLFFILFSSLPVHSHSLSTSFAELKSGPSLVLKVAILDLQLVLNWSTHRDLTWSSVKNQHQQIQNYLQQHLILHDKSRKPQTCVWSFDVNNWQLVTVDQQYYLQLGMKTECKDSHWLHYQLFTELHEHKALFQTSLGERIVSKDSPWLEI